jgi:uncharacterized protein YjbJ (UPF0337 family)
MTGKHKMRNSTQGAVGKAKQKTGEATGDRSMENRGRGEKSKADLKQAGEKVKDAFRQK